MRKKISVIIPSYNSAKTLPRTLSSIEEQTRRDWIDEIIVVDSSDDPDMEALRADFQARGVRWICAGRRVMPALSRNLGARSAGGELLAFIDADVYLAPDWIEKIFFHYERGAKLGGGAVLVPEFQKSKWVALAQYFLQFNEYVQSGPARVKEFLPSCNMFCGRDLFFEAGGFPEIRASEDVMFFKEAGKREKVWFIPEARAYHIFRERVFPFLENQKLLGKYVIIYRRNLMAEKFYYKKKWPILFLPGFALIKFFRISNRILRSGPAMSLRYALVFPVFALGFYYWMVGFYRGSRQ